VDTSILVGKCQYMDRDMIVIILLWILVEVNG
jgi:hypothetical protein